MTGRLDFFDGLAGSKSVVSWAVDVGYRRAVEKNDLEIDDDEWYVIAACATPSGSNWRKYQKFRSIRLWRFSGQRGEYLVFSVATIEEVAGSQGEVLPQTTIWVFDAAAETKLRAAKSVMMTALELADDRGVDDATSKVSTALSRGVCYVTLDCREEVSRQDAWKHVEAALLGAFFQLPNAPSFSTLSTPQDNVERFDLRAYLEEDVPRTAFVPLAVIRVDAGGRLGVESVPTLALIVRRLFDYMGETIRIRRLKLSILIMIGLIAGMVIGFVGSRFPLRDSDGLAPGRSSQAATLLRAAEQLEGAREPGGAAELYHHLLTEFPDTSQARAAESRLKALGGR